MTYDLDTIDRRILALLKEDGRMPSSQIARRIGAVSERSVRYRIDRLRRSGVLRIAAVLNPLALGYTSTGDVLIDLTRVRTIIVPWKLKEECDWGAPAKPAEGGAPMR
ncbi:MAG: AsnC family transcriptional regulator [Thermoleophilia bacterium]|nr:AsnC family transcriptional regulator [Thermoleophilia bacterium]